jgi:hypothetical protein
MHWLFLAIVAVQDIECWHFDIKNAFTESKLKEKIVFWPPPSVDVQLGYVLDALGSI